MCVGLHISLFFCTFVPDFSAYGKEEKLTGY